MKPARKISKAYFSSMANKFEQKRGGKRVREGTKIGDFYALEIYLVCVSLLSKWKFFLQQRLKSHLFDNSSIFILKLADSLYFWEDFLLSLNLLPPISSARLPAASMNSVLFLLKPIRRTLLVDAHLHFSARAIAADYIFKPDFPPPISSLILPHSEERLGFGFSRLSSVLRHSSNYFSIFT